jgi:hypothetical protein
MNTHCRPIFAPGTLPARALRSKQSWLMRNSFAATERPTVVPASSKAPDATSRMDVSLLRSVEDREGELSAAAGLCSRSEAMPDAPSDLPRMHVQKRYSFLDIQLRTALTCW